MVTADPFLPIFVIIAFIALVSGIILRSFKQPPVIAYIITGILVGSHGFSLIKNTELISNLGSLGVVLLLFFVGMEMSISKLVANWKIAIIGTFLQIMISLVSVGIFGFFVHWPINRIILFGFVISLSSTAVLIKILEERKKLDTKLGRDIISVLITQDLAVVPMIMIISTMGSAGFSIKNIILQTIGTILIGLIVYWIFKNQTDKKKFKFRITRGFSLKDKISDLFSMKIRMPYREKIQQDKDFQLLAAFVICFGFALLSGLFQLSSALGAFIGGMFIANAKEIGWVHENLKSFKTLFVALFFVSIGLLIDLRFIWDNLFSIIGLVILVFFMNTIINAIIFRALNENWRYSFYAGALLAQIGEFSFVLVSIGLVSGVITDYSYNMTISIIAISLILSPMWINLFYNTCIKC